jgi:hypothetical protein
MLDENGNSERVLAQMEFAEFIGPYYHKYRELFDSFYPKECDKGLYGDFIILLGSIMNGVDFSKRPIRYKLKEQR